MKVKMNVIAVAAAIFLNGCTASNMPVDTRNSSLTHGNVQMNVRVGETTQTQILEVFGAPNISTIDGTGQEVWSYQRAATATQSNSNSASWTILLAGGSSETAGFSSTSRMITLIIKFNKEKIVSDFNSRSSNF